VVFDEIHAYDTYMITIIERLLKELKRIGCSVVMLSATLPLVLKKKLISAWGENIQKDVAYPRMTICTTGKVKSIELPSPQPKRIKLVHYQFATYDDLAQAIVAKVKNGGTCGVFCNTVSQTQEVFLACDKLLNTGECIALHARYTEEDRKEIEEKLTQRCGPTSIGNDARPKFVVVGSPIMGESLNVDFDYVFLFNCPLDLAFQRLGRLRRFDNAENPPKRPTEQYECTIIYEKDKYGLLKNYIYDPFVMEVSYKYIKKFKELIIPDMIDEAVGSIYKDASQFSPDELRFYKSFNCKEIDKRQSATNWIMPDDESEWYHVQQASDVVRIDKRAGMSEPDEESPGTRLPEYPSIKVAIVFKGDRYYLDPENKRPVNVRSQPEMLFKNRCPMIGELMVRLFLENNPIEWNRTRLKYCGLLILEQDQKGRWTKIITLDKQKIIFRYDRRYGLNITYEKNEK
jgi:CRISPR-associated helicase Cas3